MWGPVFEALWVGVKVTVWLFTGIIRGPSDAFRWYEARQRGDHYGFPVMSVLWFLIAAGVILGCFVMTAGQ